MSKGPSRQELIENQKGLNVYEVAYDVRFGKKGERLERVLYTSDALSDSDAILYARGHWARNVEFLLRDEECKEVSFVTMRAKRAVDLGTQTYVWQKQDFGLKRPDWP